MAKYFFSILFACSMAMAHCGSCGEGGAHAGKHSCEKESCKGHGEACDCHKDKKESCDCKKADGDHKHDDHKHD